MPAIDPDKVRAQLEALRDEIVQAADSARDAAQTVDLDQTRVGRLSRMDALQGQAMAQASAQRQAALLDEIEEALQRLEEGSYGRCLECGEWIAEGRLEIDPVVRYCIKCAGKLEQ